MRLKGAFLVLFFSCLLTAVFAQEPSERSRQQPRPGMTEQQTQFMNTVRARIREVLRRERGREDALWEQMNGLIQNLDYLQHEQKHRDLTTRERARLQELQLQLQSLTRTMASERDVRLKDRESVVGLERAYTAWRRKPSDAAWMDMTSAITEVARSKGIHSSVRIDSKDPGAVIKYQTVYDRSKGQEPVTATQETACVETMPIGYYHVWLERKGKVTSDKTAVFYIAASEEEIVIVEQGQ